MKVGHGEKHVPQTETHETLGEVLEVSYTVDDTGTYKDLVQ